jgi:hypothetical protein
MNSLFIVAVFFLLCQFNNGMLKSYNGMPVHVPPTTLTTAWE